MNVLNGEPFIRYQLDSIYKHAHEIIVVEGAYEKFSHAASGFRSRDNTLKLIKQYPDTARKIRLITQNYFYKDRLEMCNEFMSNLTGDILWQVDVDEFYHDKTHQYVRELFLEDHTLDQISFRFFDYYKNTKWVIEGYESVFLDVIRVNRIIKGMKWKSQRPPTLALGDIEISPRNRISGDQMAQKEHYMHNATMLFDQQVYDKFCYYNSMWPSSIFSGSEDWYIKSWKEFQIHLSVAGFKDRLTYLKENYFEVPKELLAMEMNIRANKHPGIYLSDDRNIERVVSDVSYNKVIALAEQINSLSECKGLSFFLNSIRYLILTIKFPASEDKGLMIYVIVKTWLNKTYRLLRKPLKKISAGLKKVEFIL
jgi:hypothetical protein